MADWKQLAAVLAPDIPPERIEQMAPVLDNLRQQLDALLGEVPEAPGCSIVFRPLEDR